MIRIATIAHWTYDFIHIRISGQTYKNARKTLTILSKMLDMEFPYKLV
jgi:hypothetical protein